MDNWTAGTGGDAARVHARSAQPGGGQHDHPGGLPGRAFVPPNCASRAPAEASRRPNPASGSPKPPSSWAKAAWVLHQRLLSPRKTADGVREAAVTALHSAVAMRGAIVSTFGTTVSVRERAACVRQSVAAMRQTIVTRTRPPIGCHRLLPGAVGAAFATVRQESTGRRFSAWARTGRTTSLSVLHLYIAWSGSN